MRDLKLVSLSGMASAMSFGFWIGVHLTMRARR